MKYAFNLLRSRAKERGKVFTLTFEDYAALCAETEYFKLKGKTAASLSINRIDNARGYEPGNLNVLTLAENTRRNYVPRLRQYAEQFGVKL